MFVIARHEEDSYNTVGNCKKITSGHLKFKRCNND